MLGGDEKRGGDMSALMPDFCGPAVDLDRGTQQASLGSEVTRLLGGHGLWMQHSESDSGACGRCGETEW
jgi:hypothetical protein